MTICPCCGSLRHIASQSEVDRVFAALADPTRRALLERLTGGPLSVTRLAEPFEMSLAAVVQHLQALERAGLVRTEKVGRVRTCRIDPAGLAVASGWIGDRRSRIERRLDRLGELLAADAEPARMDARPAGSTEGAGT